MFNISDHYDGQVFHNRERMPHGATDFLKWVTDKNRNKIVWPKGRQSQVRSKPELSIDSGIKVTFINHATVLLQVAGINILTDPIWSQRCSPVQFLGPKRHQNPGIHFADLPPIHLVLISHNHYDHFDVSTVKQLITTHNPQFIMGIGNTKLFKKLHTSNVAYLDWWQHMQISARIQVHFVPAQHFSGRTLWDRDKSLWGGFWLETDAGNIFFAGDTGYGSHFKEISARLGALRLALLPIGAYQPRWFMRHVHMNPDDAVRAHLDLSAQLSMGIHFGTFQLTDEGIDAPKIELQHALLAHGVAPDSFWAPEFGESRLLMNTV